MEWDGSEDCRVYVIGPLQTGGDMITGTKNAVDMGTVLANIGYIPFIPHLSSFWHYLHPAEPAFWLKQDFAWLRVCHAVLRLPGASNGGDKEEALARSLGIPVFRSVEELNAWRSSKALPQVA